MTKITIMWAAVAEALLLYQNDDGGFGHGLDMDNWNPNSVPYNCLFALELLRLAGFDDMTHHTIQRDPAQWQHYGYCPSEFIKSNDSIFCQGNKDIVEKELDYLVDTMP